MGHKSNNRPQIELLTFFTLPHPCKGAPGPTEHLVIHLASPSTNICRVFASIGTELGTKDAMVNKTETDIFLMKFIVLLGINKDSWQHLDLRKHQDLGKKVREGYLGEVTSKQKGKG